MTERQKKILTEIIRFHIRTGEPVGSKNLKEATGMNISSATIRNEMSELAEHGFLDQPHTSSGRVPSISAYRLYVDSLMERRSLSPREKRILDALLPDRVSHPEQLPETAADILARLTGFAAISTTPSDENATVKAVQVIEAGPNTAVLVLLTSGGIVKSGYCKTPVPMDADLLESFVKAVQSEIVGRPLNVFNPAKLQSVAANFEEHTLVMASLFSSLFDLLREAGESELKLRGEANLLNHKEFGDGRLRDLLNALGSPRKILSALDRGSVPVTVIMGREADMPGEAGMVVARYRFGSGQTGRIGIVGPLRIPYDDIIPQLEYLAFALGELYSRFLE